MFERTIVGICCTIFFPALLVGQNAKSQQCVVLHNGQTITGTVEKSPTQTVIVTPNGSRLVMDNRKVDKVVRSVDEAYWWKCANLSATDLAGHTTLFHWCLSHKLFANAQNQIDLMQSMRANPTRLRGMRQNLHRKLAAERARIVAEQQHKEKERFAMRDLPELQYDQETGVVRQVSYELPGALAQNNQKQNPANDSGMSGNFFKSDLQVENVPRDSRTPNEPAKAVNLANASRIPKPQNSEQILDSDQSPKIARPDPFDPEVFNRLYLKSDLPES